MQWKAFELKSLEILPSSACQHLYLNVFSARDQFCTVVQAKEDITFCRNEIGASICKKPGSNSFDSQGCELLGIVTHGAGCGTPGHRSGFRLATGVYKFKDWIEEMTENSETGSC